MKNLENKVIALAADHAGYDKKEVIKKFFNEHEISYKDLGCFSDESCDYPEFAHAIGAAVSKGEYDIGITFCGSGQGISITANKHKNVRSALCWNAKIGALAKQHNDANICSIPSRYVTDQETIDIVKAFLNAEFEGGRHARRVAKIPINE